MKKLTTAIFASTLALVAAGGAHAEIASKAYVDKKDGDLTTLTTTNQTNLVAAINEVDSTGKANTASITTITGTTIPAMQRILDGVATDEGMTQLAGRVTTAEGDIDTLQGFQGRAEGFATSAQGDKADSALQAAAIADMLTKTEAGTTYAGIATEGVASGAAARAATNATAIGTLGSLTTTEKTNLVGAINEVKSILGSVDNATIADIITETTADGKYAVKATEGIASGAAARAATNATAIGTLGSLTTTEKTNLVGAINEIKGILGDIDAPTMTDVVTKTVADTLYDTKGSAAAVQTNLTTFTDRVAGFATSAQGAKADAAIPAPQAACANPTSKCVLTTNGTTFEWEVVER